ncbi:MAG: hypothetical protein ABEN55_17755 [Bradymonadaceae bacterium]
MTDGKTKGGEDYEVTEEHPDVRYEDEYPEEEDYEVVESYPDEEGRGRRRRKKVRMESKDDELEQSTAEIWAGGEPWIRPSRVGPRRRR